MKSEHTYVVYFTDADGSERKGATVLAKSPGHAVAIARKQGVTKITDAVKA